LADKVNDVPPLAKRALIFALDVIIAGVLWPLAALAPTIGVGDLLASADPQALDEPFMLAFSCASIVVFVGWVAHAAVSIKKRKTPAAAIWARAARKSTG
jgi:hypothetical protein